VNNLIKNSVFTEYSQKNDNMEITKLNITKNIIKISVAGRLDAYWSTHLEKELEEILHSDVHDIRLNLDNVEYISSAGIRILLQYYKKLKSINGAFAIVSISEEAQQVIELAGLLPLINKALNIDDSELDNNQSKKSDEENPIKFIQNQQKENITFELLGNPDLLTQTNSKIIKDYKFNNNMFGLGIGELAGQVETGTHTFGEFLNIYGAGAYLPTDDSNMPDYIIESHNLLPSFNILYGISVKGNLQKQFRFDSNKKESNFKLSDIIDICKQNSNANKTALVFISETNGLVGAALRNDPRNSDAEDFFEFPSVRKNISFASESIFKRCLTISAGIFADANVSEDLNKFLRPLNSDNKIFFHIHSVTFPFIPLSKDENDYKKIIKNIFDTHPPLGLIHLLNDEREINGIGESEFTRGVCWFGEIK
jgi:anti-anti-sigma factor